MTDSKPTGSPETWLRQAIDRYERPLLAYATRMLEGDRERAQDAVQETFLRLCQTPQGKIEDRLAAWLYTVCRTRVIDMQRTKWRQPEAVAMDPGSTPADPSPNPATICQTKDDTNQLAALIQQLAPRQQEILRLRLNGGLSYREIANATGLTTGSVGSHLHDAICALRRSIKQTIEQT